MWAKYFGILIEGEGEGGAQGAAIAVIARDRKPKTLPRIDADERGSLQGCTSKCTPNWDHLGWGGIPREG